MSTVLAAGRTGTGAPFQARVLVISGSNGVAELTDTLARLGHHVVEHEARQGLPAELDTGSHDLVFVESELLESLSADPGFAVPVIVLVDDAGAVPPPRCIGAIPRAQAVGLAPAFVALAAELRAVRERCEDLDRLVGGIRDGSAIVGRTPVMRRVLGALARAADGDATILIEGAPGTGKSLAARAVHCKSRRGNRPIVVTEAQGLEADGMTDAFARARGSTLVIENVEQLPQAAQQALVRFLKERAPARGGDAPVARIVATTSAHLPELVARGSFREDLYYRLHVLPLVMPSLRERTEDIALLARALLDQIAIHSSHRPHGFTPAALVLLESMSWPGNVAQLESVVRRAWLMAAGAPIDREHLGSQSPVSVAATPAAPASADDQLGEDAIRPFEEEEQRLLSRALRATRGNVRRAAQLLGIGRATLYRKIQQYRLRLH